MISVVIMRMVIVFLMGWLSEVGLSLFVVCDSRLMLVLMRNSVIIIGVVSFMVVEKMELVCCSRKFLVIVFMLGSVVFSGYQWNDLNIMFSRNSMLFVVQNKVMVRFNNVLLIGVFWLFCNGLFICMLLKFVMLLMIVFVVCVIQNIVDVVQLRYVFRKIFLLVSRNYWVVFRFFVMVGGCVVVMMMVSVQIMLLCVVLGMDWLFVVGRIVKMVMMCMYDSVSSVRMIFVFLLRLNQVCRMVLIVFI